MAKLISVKDAAEFLGVSRMKISKMLKSGALVAEVNPLDTREKLIPIEQLELLKGYPTAKEAPTHKPDTDELVELLERIAVTERTPEIPHDQVKAELARLKAARRLQRVSA